MNELTIQKYVIQNQHTDNMAMIQWVIFSILFAIGLIALVIATTAWFMGDITHKNAILSIIIGISLMATMAIPIVYYCNHIDVYNIQELAIEHYKYGGK